MNITDYNTTHKFIQVERNNAAWTIVDNVKFFDFLAEINTFSKVENNVWMHDPINGSISISGCTGTTRGTVYTYERFFVAYKDELQDMIKSYCEADDNLVWTKKMLYA